MKTTVTEQDNEFKIQVESGEFPVPDFDHRAHLRLAYIYLAENEASAAVELMRNSLIGLLIQAGINPDKKYHETLTQAWVKAVNHFIINTERSDSADDFIDQNKAMLDSKIMMTHYSTEVLFSDKARQSFIEPNLEPIPSYNN